MKIIILLLIGLCIFMTSAERQTEVLFSNEIDEIPIAISTYDVNFYVYSGLQHFIEALIRNALEMLGELSYRFENLVLSIKQDLKDFFTQSLADLEDYLKKLEEELIILGNVSEETTKECLNKYRPELRAILENSQQKLNACISEGFDQVHSLKSEIQKHFETVMDEVNKLKSIFTNCTQAEIFDPFDTVMCFYKNIGELKKGIDRILSESKQCVKAIAKKLFGILKDTRKCLNRAIEETRKKIDEIFIKIKECAKPIKPTTTTSTSTTITDATTQATTTSLTEETSPISETAALKKSSGSDTENIIPIRQRFMFFRRWQ